MGIYRRESAEITFRACNELALARKHAHNIGLTLNTSATIHWAAAGGDGTARERQAALIERTRKWLERREVAWTAVWVIETGTMGKDIHTHFALHLPKHVSRAEFETYWRQQLQSPYQNVLKIDTIRDIGWHRYMLKGSSPETRQAFGVPKAFEDARNLVIGKRCGFSQNLGPAARARYIAQQKLARQRAAA